MASKESGVSFSAIKQSLKNRQFAPVYLLHGEESYGVDNLTEIFAELLPESERAFNFYTLYGQDTNAAFIADTCRRFPMMSDYQVVIVKDFQAINAKTYQPLLDYLASPTLSTILVLCVRGVRITSKTLPAAVKAAGGVIFESAKLKDRDVEPAIREITKNLGLNIDLKGVEMLKEYIGTDMSRLYNELEKMAVVLPKGATITPESIEENIGISKDYNNFELVNAIAEKKVDKIYKILRYFRSNPKNNPTVVTASTIFGFFSKLLIYHYTRDKSPASLKAALGFTWDSQLKDYNIGARNYNAFKVIEIISAIREFDTRSKGIDSRQSEWDLLHDLLFRIVTAEGQITI